VEAMNKILSLNKAEDFVIATGELHTVKEFIEVAFSHLGLDWQKYVTVDRNLLPTPSRTLMGDSSKLRKRTGWTPRTSFTQLVKILVDTERKNSTR
jgi:GDPmannose 4,6-dehydratase